MSQKGKCTIGKHFAPARFRDPTLARPQPAEAAQLGVGIGGGLEEFAHAVTVALQTHPFSPSPAVPLANHEGWVCISIDFKNFFNSILRPAIFRALLAVPGFVDLYHFLVAIYSKGDPAQLCADLGGGQEWDDVLSREGVQQGCSFGSFLAALALQPILEAVARTMPECLIAAYCDDVRICAPIPVALAAYRLLRRLARKDLGCEEVPSKGSAMWEGEMSHVALCSLSMFPSSMPGRTTRILHDKHLGVFVGDSRPESVAAVKAALHAKFEDKAALITRLRILSDPQIKLNLLRSCASTRPGFWLRTMSPSLTTDSSAWFDARLRECMDEIAAKPLTDHARLLATLPKHLSGLGLTSAMATRFPAHFASWLGAWSHITRMFPSAISLTANDLSTSTLPFALGLQASHHAVSSAAIALADNMNRHPLPFHAPTNPEVTDLSDFGTRQPHAQKSIASAYQSARWLNGFHFACSPARACMLSQSDQGAMAGFSAVPCGKAALTPSSFVTALQLRLRLPPHYP